jgi:hypothetical protein
MRVLIAYSSLTANVNTTMEFLRSFKSFPCEVVYLNVVYQPFTCFRLDQFDVILVSYCARLINENYVSIFFKKKLELFKGIKGIFIQDEYDNTFKMVETLNRIKPQLIFTCVPEESVNYVYSGLNYSNYRFIRVLTGYASDEPDEIDRLPSIEQRKIVIGYRARKLSAAYGELGRAKFDIGRVIKNQCQKLSIPHDIEWAENKRIYGRDWIAWLRSVKATLISESGSNIFDFNGDILNECQRYEAQGLDIPIELKKKIEKKDLEICMGQISPRVFEALENGCALIGYEGEYSSILKPNVHYLALKRDESNLEEVMSGLNDSTLQQFWKRAYDDIILSEKYSYKAFASKVYQEINNSLTDGKMIEKPNKKSFFSYFVRLHTDYPKSIGRIQAKSNKIISNYLTFKW